MMLTTGILMLGNMSVGVRKIAIKPIARIRTAITTNVYGLRNANFTIHINPSSLLDFVSAEFLGEHCGSFPHDPLAQISGTISELRTLRFAICQEPHDVPVDQPYLFQVENDALVWGFGLQERLQFRQLFRLDPA